jgi:hypothetical protein
MNARPTASPTSLMAFQAASVRVRAKAQAKEKLDGIRARALTESTVRDAKRQRLATARADMAALMKRRRSTQ